MLTDTFFWRRADAVPRQQEVRRQAVPERRFEDGSREPGSAGAWWLPAVSCYRPLPAHRDRSGGSVRIGYKDDADKGDKLELPCGRCVGCRLDRARAWSIRIGHEAQLWDANLFVTFDYSPAALPKSLSLEYRDFQGFMKRLRRRVSGVSLLNGQRPIRFFVAGEYGKRFGRPHWHAILFNCWMPDQVRYINGTYRSQLMEDLWDRGNCVIGDVTARSAAYVAGYTLAKAHSRAEDYEDVVDPATGEVFARRPEFVVMSRRPGIGGAWYDRFGGDLFPGDRAVQDGQEYKVPRYYTEKFKRSADPGVIEALLEKRYQRSQEVPREESSEERRAVREAVSVARVHRFGERSH